MKLFAEMIAILATIEFFFVVGIAILGCTVDVTWAVIASGVAFIIACIIAYKND